MAKWQSDIPAHAKNAAIVAFHVAREWQDTLRTSSSRRPSILDADPGDHFSCTFHTPVPQTVPQVDSGIGSAPLPAPEIGSRHRCTPFTARVRLPVSLCHIANSKNAREFNASHNQLRRVKLRTVNSHFATLPVRHRASGMFLKNQKTDKVVAVNAPAKLICLRPQGFSPSCPAALFEAP